MTQVEIPVEERLTKLENKIDLFIEENRATQRAIALLKADFKEIVTDSINSVLNKRAIEGYSRIVAGK